MAHSRLWSTYESKPSGTDNINTGDDEIRSTKIDIRERLEIDHEMNTSTTVDGRHKKVTLKDYTTDPTFVAGYGIQYSKTVGGIVEQHYVDSAGTIKQITSNGKLNIATGDITTTVAALVGAMLFPVGSIYTATVSTNPATLLGFGTWTACGAGRVLVGVGTSDAAYAAGATGGVSTVTLSATQSGVAAHTHTKQGVTDIVATFTGGGSANYQGYIAGTENVGTATATAAASAHDNMPPYLVVYHWQRTA